MTERWHKGVAHWTDDTTAYLSIVFTWDVPRAYSLALWYREQGYTVRAGGPGTFTMGRHLQDVAQIGGDMPDALIRHNPDATRASKGCPVGCSFCIVPRFEGKAFTLFPEFTPRPILIDNNLSALPVDYQRHIIERYQYFGVPLEDANSGFEPQTFDGDTYQRWRTINRGPWRLAYDTTDEGDDVHRALMLLRDVPAWRKRIYVLIGNEPFDACMRRILQVIEWGGEPHVQPMIALNSTAKRPLVRHGWTAQMLADVARWANRWLWRQMTFAEYKPRLV